MSITDQGAAATALEPYLDAPESIAALTVGADGATRLLGSECAACATRFFPRRHICFECAGTDVQDLPLAGAGTLYTWTTVRVSAAMAVPYALGYVDLDDGVRVLTHLDPDATHSIGQRVELQAVSEQGDGAPAWRFVGLSDEGGRSDA